MDGPSTELVGVLQGHQEQSPGPWEELHSIPQADLVWAAFAFVVHTVVVHTEAVVHTVADQADHKAGHIVAAQAVQTQSEALAGEGAAAAEAAADLGRMICYPFPQLPITEFVANS